jgi:hypothetical protein
MCVKSRDVETANLVVDPMTTALQRVESFYLVSHSMWK